MSLLENFETTDYIPSEDPVCIECGAALSYSGRGRKPKYCDEHKPSRSAGTGTRKSSTSSVDSAMASLKFFEDMLCIPLMFISRDAAKEWVAGLPDAREKNRVILEGNPALCKAIGRTASKVGPWALVGSYGYAMAPVAKIVYNDIRERRSSPVVHPINLVKTDFVDPNDIDAVAFGKQS